MSVHSMRYMPMIRNINFHEVKHVGWFNEITGRLGSQYSFVSADDVKPGSGEYSRGKSCHLTFDDGDISFYEIIFPVLKKKSIPATLFVSPRICSERSNFWFQEVASFSPERVRKVISELTGIIPEKIKNSRVDSIMKTMRLEMIREIIVKCRDGLQYSNIPFRNINTEQLIEIDRSGLVTIGAHTLNHPILKNEDDETSFNEIRESIDELAVILGHEVKYFAYPNGIPGLDFSGREKNILLKCGIRLAFKNESMDLISDNDPMAIPRIAITDGETFGHINFKLHLPELWYSMKKLNPRSEYRERSRLSKAFPVRDKRNAKAIHY